MRNAGWLIAAAVCLALLVAFVYGYPRAFSVIERDHPGNYQQRVAELIAEGDESRAIRFATHAAATLQFDPDAWTLLAELHRDAGDSASAQSAAGEAVAIRQTLSDHPTQRPWYHAPARLLLSDLSLEHGYGARAAAHLELARPYYEGAPDALAERYARLNLPLRAAALRGDALAPGDSPRERIYLENIRQYRPWEPCQLIGVRLDLYDDGLIDLEWSWADDSLPLAPVSLPTRVSEVPMEMAAIGGSPALGDDAPEKLPLAIPGFQTTPYLWHDGSRLSLVPGDRPIVVIEREGAPGNAMITTLPARADGHSFVAIRVRATGAPASIVWFAEDSRERESFRDTFEPVPPGDWTWRAAYHPASHHWEVSWLQVGLYDDAGRVEIDRVVILSLPADASPCGNAP